jgi:hypothetical protein
MNDELEYLEEKPVAVFLIHLMVFVWKDSE